MGVQAVAEAASRTDKTLNAFVFHALQQHKLSGLAEMLRFIAETFDAYACILWRLAPGGNPDADPPEGRLFVLAQWLQDQRFWSKRILSLDSNTGDAIRKEAPICVPDVSKNERIDQSDPLWAVEGVKTFCAVPLTFLDGQPGTVNVYRVSHAFTNEEISRIQALADFVPALYQTIRDKVSSWLSSCIDAILQSAELRTASAPCSFDDMKEVVQEIGEAVAKEFHAAEVSVFFEDRFSAPGTYDRVATTWKGEFQKTAYTVGEPTLTSWILTHQQSVNIFDLLDFRDEREKANIQLRYPGLEWSDSLNFESRVRDFFPQAGDQGLPPLSFMGVPIKAGKDVLGVIRCCTALEPPYYFAEGELRLLELVAARLSQYWINWIVRRESERENQSWRGFIERVNEMNRGVQNDVIAGSLNQDRVYEEALKIAEDVIPAAETLDIRLLDEVQSELYYGPTRGIRWQAGSKRERQARLERRYRVTDPPDSIGAQVVLSRKPFVMNQPDPLYHGPFLDTTAMIVAPLRSHNRVTGVIDIRTSQRSPFPKYAVSIAELLGQQLGLYEDLAMDMRKLTQAQNELKLLLRNQTASYQDLGHQLKTPVFQAEARMNQALRSKELADDLRSQLNPVRGLIRKTKRVSRSISLFAQLADKKTIPTQMRVADPDRLVQSIIEYAIDHQGLSGPECPIEFQVERKGFTVLRSNEIRLDYGLLEQALNNVLDNALKYSFQRTTVRISAGLADKGRFYISVVNKGIRLGSNEVEDAKKRGWRSDTAEGITGEGSGIGLWIVDHIMKAMGGELRIHPTTAEDLTDVRLLFPVTKGASD